MREVWPDTSNIDKKYWNKVLDKAGLSMNKGRNRKLSYGHDYSRQPDDIQRCGGGRKTPPKQTLGQIDKEED